MPNPDFFIFNCGLKSRLTKKLLKKTDLPIFILTDIYIFFFWPLTTLSFLKPFHSLIFLWPVFRLYSLLWLCFISLPSFRFHVFWVSSATVGPFKLNMSEIELNYLAAYWFFILDPIAWKVGTPIHPLTRLEILSSCFMLPLLRVSQAAGLPCPAGLKSRTALGSAPSSALPPPLTQFRHAASLL